MNEHDARWMALAAWYRGSNRDLPWRGSPDPWVILVSEIMLQQTQAPRVVRRIGSFLDEFPQPTTMATASLQQVLAAWSGLGYNRRAIRLHEAARLIDEEGWPRTAADLRRLPGVGEYTAAAVACFAFGEHVPAIDVNVRRVLSRWADHLLTPGEARNLADGLLPPDEAHQWTQAIMDLGATICTARNPACRLCPCEPWCQGAHVSVSSRPQGRFEGSLRQARGAIVRALGHQGRIDLDVLQADLARDRLDEAALALQKEGLIDVDEGIVTLRDP